MRHHLQLTSIQNQQITWARRSFRIRLEPPFDGVESGPTRGWRSAHFILILANGTTVGATGLGHGGVIAGNDVDQPLATLPQGIIVF